MIRRRTSDSASRSRPLAAGLSRTMVPAVAAVLAGLIGYGYAMRGFPVSPALVAAGCIGLLAAGIVVRRMRTTGSFDAFHPLLFPSIYVGVSFLLPSWLVLGRSQEIGLLELSTLPVGAGFSLAAGYVGLVLGMALGLRVAPKRPSQPAEAGVRLGAKSVANGYLGLATILELWRLSTGSVADRGRGQDVYTLGDSVVAGTGIVVLAAYALLVFGAQPGIGLWRSYSRFQWLFAGLPVALSLLNGGRAAAVSVLLALMFGSFAPAVVSSYLGGGDRGNRLRLVLDGSLQKWSGSGRGTK